MQKYLVFRNIYKLNRISSCMPKLSKEKKEKIQEQILFHLFEIFPRQIFTSDIAKEIARDEEFIKILMHELEKQNLVVKIDKNPVGVQYLKRSRWRIANNVYEIYKKRAEFGKNTVNLPSSSPNFEQNSEQSLKKEENSQETLAKLPTPSYIS